MKTYKAFTDILLLSTLVISIVSYSIVVITCIRDFMLFNDTKLIVFVIIGLIQIPTAYSLYKDHKIISLTTSWSDAVQATPDPGPKDGLFIRVISIFVLLSIFAGSVFIIINRYF